MLKKHGILSKVLLLAVLLQTYQMVRLNLHFDQMHHESTLEHQQQQGKEKSFSACLMFMDDNAHLIEWLAYHYRALPLRRLIVAVDPRSQTSPSEILGRWQGLMEITEWSDVDFMPPTKMDAHKQLKDHEHDELTKLFRQRQEEFYARCMAKLKYEQKTWVALVDTDEYILPNTNSQGDYKIIGYHEKPTDMTVLGTIHRAQRENKDFTTLLEESPCLPMARLTFGVKESEPKEIQESVPFGFDGAEFQTLRWRWHGGRSQKRLNKISKSIIDVSRVDSSLFVPTTHVMVHLPVKEHCNGDDLWILNAFSALVVHHYGGTWEQWSHRKDTRGKRTKDNYEKMKYDKQIDDSVRPWLAGFVNDVGFWKARNLLRGVGQIPNALSNTS
jgi:hypothetical protein